MEEKTIELSDNNEEYYDKLTIADANFSVRTYNCLKNSGFNYLCELVELTEADLHRIRNMGSKSVKEVIEYLSSHPLYVRKEKPDERTTFINDSFLKYLSYVHTDSLNLSVRSKNVISRNKIMTAMDLKKFDFYNAKNAGAKTAEEISNCLKSLKEDFLSFVNNNDELPDKYINSSMLDVSDCQNVICSSPNISVLDGYREFQQMKDKILNFETEKDYYTFEFFKNIFNNSSVLLNEKVQSFINSIKLNKNYVDIYISRGKGETLESLGLQYGVTRERIRQKDSKYILKIKKMYEQLNIKLFINDSVIYVGKKYLPLSEELNYLLLCRLDEIDENYIRVDFNNCTLMINKSYYDTCMSFVEKIALQIENNNYIDKKIIVESNYDSTLLDYLLSKKQIMVFGEYAIFKTTKRGKTAIYLEKSKMIDISTKDKLEYVMADINATFNLEIENERVLRSYLEDCAYPLGNGKFVPYSVHPIITEYTLNNIFKDIEDKKIVNCKILYHKYKNEIDNMLSPTHLYSYLKREFPNKFNYGGNNITISIFGYEPSNAGLVYDYIKKSEGPVDGADIMLNNNVDNVALSVIVSQNKDIFRLNNNNDYYLISKLIRIDDLQKYINNYIESLSKERIYLRDIYIYIFNIDKCLLSDNYIYSMEELLNIINIIGIKSLIDYSYEKTTKQFVKNKQVMDLFGDEI